MVFFCALLIRLSACESLLKTGRVESGRDVANHPTVAQGTSSIPVAPSQT